MIGKLKQYLLRLSVAGLFFAPAMAPAAVFAQAEDSIIQNNLCGGATSLSIGEGGECTDETPQDEVNSLITTVINIFSAIVGVVAVIMIVYGGFKYITSGGDSGKITSAQQSIIYAIVGLIIVALAQVVVRFVLFRAVGNAN